MTAINASHLLTPGAVAAETGPAAAADNPCPPSAFSAVDQLAFADGAATATCHMDDSGLHMLAASRKWLVACDGWLTIVDWLGRGHMHSWRIVMHRWHVMNCWWLVMHRGDVMSRCLMVDRGVVLSVMCHSIL